MLKQQYMNINVTQAGRVLTIIVPNTDVLLRLPLSELSGSTSSCGSLYMAVPASIGVSKPTPCHALDLSR